MWFWRHFRNSVKEASTVLERSVVTLIFQRNESNLIGTQWSSIVLGPTVTDLTAGTAHTCAGKKKRDSFAICVPYAFIHSFIHSLGGHFSIHFYFTYLFVGAGPVCAPIMTPMWWPEDSMQESVPSYCVGSRYCTQVIRLHKAWTSMTLSLIP